MTKKLVVLKIEKKVLLNTEKDIFLGSVKLRVSRVTFYVHRSKNGKVFYVDEWNAWLNGFNGLAVIDEWEAKNYLRQGYTGTCDYNMEAVKKIWPDFLEEVD
jgi:hypothetical protein